MGDQLALNWALNPGTGEATGNGSGWAGSLRAAEGFGREEGWWVVPGLGWRQGWAASVPKRGLVIGRAWATGPGQE